MSTASGDRGPQEATASGERAPQEGTAGAGRRWRYVWLVVAAVWAGMSTAYFCAYQSPHPISGPLRGWDWFWNPRERFPEMRLPSIATTLRSTHFAADGQRGWAVGDNGTILQTKDGGAIWAPHGIIKVRNISSLRCWLRFAAMLCRLGGHYAGSAQEDGLRLSVLVGCGCGCYSASLAPYLPAQ